MARPFIPLVLIILVTLGCATLHSGRFQLVSINSTPQGASVTINGVVMGNTPFYADLERKKGHVVQVNLEGYQPFQITLTRGKNGWIWGNVISFGLIGVVVDVITGAVYKLEPEQVSAMMVRSTAIKKNDGLYIMTVLKSDNTWTKVGQLSSVN